MERRIDFRKYAQEAQKAMYGLEKYIAESGLESQANSPDKDASFPDQRLRVLH